MALLESVQGVIDKLIKDASSKAARMATAIQLSVLARTTDVRRATDFRNATAVVKLKYSDLDKVVSGYQPYHPVSLSFFEPVNLSERYHWLMGLELSFPIALLKVAVGGSLGTLVWVVKRDESIFGIEDGNDEDDLEDARRLLQPLVPKVSKGESVRHAARCQGDAHAPASAVYRIATTAKS